MSGRPGQHDTWHLTELVIAITLAGDFQIKQATAAVQIGAGPNPHINAVDMVVLASLTRTSAAHNLPEVIGSKAQPIIEAFARLEKDAWSLVDFLTLAEQADLRRRLAAWTPDAASLDSVTFNRLEDFAEASGLPANQQIAPIASWRLSGLTPWPACVRQCEKSSAAASSASGRSTTPNARRCCSTCRRAR